MNRHTDISWILVINNIFATINCKSNLQINNIICVTIGFDTFVQQLLSLNFVFSFEVKICRIFSQSLVELRQHCPCPKITHVSWRTICLCDRRLMWGVWTNLFMSSLINHLETCLMSPCSPGRRWDNPQSWLSVFCFLIENTSGLLELAPDPRP